MATIPVIFPDHGNAVKQVPAADFDKFKAKGGVRAYKMNFYNEADGKKTLNVSKWVPADKVEHYQKELKGELAPMPGDTGGAIIDPATGKPRGESHFGRDLTAVTAASEPITATAGGLIGGAVGGPVGAIAGATAGGAIGAGIAEKAETGKVTPGEVAKGGVEQGALEFVGGMLVPKMLAKLGSAAGPKVLKTVNNYIGLKPSDLPKWGRTVEDSDVIAKTVMSEAGIKKTLPAQRDAIELARTLRNAQTEQVVKTPLARSVDFDARILDRAVELDKAVSLGEFPEATKGMIDANLKELQNIAIEHGASASGKMLPEQMHAMRKSIQQQIKDWNPETTNPRQWLLQRVYHDLNDSIAQGLPDSEARMFRANNKIQTNLIIAREATKEKLLSQQLKSTPGIVTSTVNRVGGAAVGALSGATIAGETGSNKGHGAIIGGLIGAGLGSYARHLGKAELPSMDVAAMRSIEKAAPYVAKAAAKSPHAVRGVQGIIDAIRSQRSQQP